MNYLKVESQDINRSTKLDKLLSFTICTFISFNQILYFINILFNFFVSNFIYDTMLSYIALMVLLVISLFKIGRTIKIDIIFLLIILLILYLGSYLLNFQNREYMFTSIFDYRYNPFYNLFFFAFPLYLLVRQIMNYNILKHMLYIFSVVVLVISNLMFILKFSGMQIELQYMVFSYNMVFFICYLIYDFTINRRKISLLLAGISFIIVFIAGARGPVIVIFSYIILFVVFNIRANLKKILPIIIIMVLTFFIIATNFTYILTKTNMFLIKNNYSSRTITMILENNIAFDSYRGEITEKIKNDILKKFLLGNGMFGDRAVTKNIFYNGQGVYAHNIIFEFLSQYGMIFGTLFIGIIFVLIIVAIFSSKDIVLKNLLLISMSSGLIKLFLSGSYLNEPYFFLMLGISVNIIQKRTNLLKLSEKGDVI